MKTLKNHVLIYDNDCPMCNLYSGAFIRAGMLENEGRQAFSVMSVENREIIDYQRSKNEIALINTRENRVIYGLESLLTIIGNSYPKLERIAKIQFLHWFFQKLYRFVSYNRKQIIPSEKDLLELNCVPSFNLKYRMLYIGFVLLFSIYIFGIYSQKSLPTLNNHFSVFFFINCMQIIWQSLFLGFYLKEKFWDYLGNMMTVSLLGSFLLIPVLFFNVDQSFYLIYLGIVVFVMFLEHYRRCTILKTGIVPAISWIFFIITFSVILWYIVSSL